jgi:hypothetical protein
MYCRSSFRFYAKQLTLPQIAEVRRTKWAILNRESPIINSSERVSFQKE